MNRKGKDISIIKLISIVFIVTMIISTGGIGYLIFSQWVLSARQTTEIISEDIGEQLHSQVNALINIPYHINELNEKTIKNEILDISNEELRTKFFAGVLSSHNMDVHSFSYALADGRFYGARRNEENKVEIMIADSSTEGEAWYYAVNEDLTKGELIKKTAKYDARTRSWYQDAANAKRPGFSSVFKHHVKDDLTVSAAWPIYNSEGELQGVLGTHMLLSGIGDYLSKIVKDYNGYAVIIEKETGELIANSFGVDNFIINNDGSIERFNICEKEEISILKAVCDYYFSDKKGKFLYSDEEGRFYVFASEIKMNGLNWVLVSAVPESFYMSNVAKNIHITLLFIMLALLSSHLIYRAATKRFLRPMNHLLEASAAFSLGDLSKRIQVERNDEIGEISKSFNKVADKMEFYINNLEALVKERTEELYKSTLELKESKKQLQLILSSTAEGVCGLDVDGNCTFINESGLKMLGYLSSMDLLGKNIHDVIHHSYKNGQPYPIEECKILTALKQGSSVKTDDEVFWRADNSFFDVEYYAHPLICESKIVGGVLTFTDVTERKEKEKEINYLSYHDALTGIYNRRGFEKYLNKIDNLEYMPISVIFADINGLKMTNDIFGHAAGDKLIKKSAEILAKASREKDIVARVGGDEFILLLPKTKKEDAEKVLLRVRSEFSNAYIEAIKCSISLGCDTKTNLEQTLEEVMTNAENAMYKDKTMNRRVINQDMIDTIVSFLHTKRPEEKRHSASVQRLSCEIGELLNLSQTDINRLKRAAYLHDIGKIVQDESLLVKEELTDEELEKMRQHPIDGYRILSLFDDTLDLAEFVYAHHENWDGSGYPRQLKGEEIPLISRIILIAETYDRAYREGEKGEEQKALALKVTEDGAGKRFDPNISKLFIEMKKKEK